MMHITEDTPPDMLAGAMDLTVHLPNGTDVKMPVERSTPMMDVLLQITTAHHLVPSGHTIEALSMAPSLYHNEKILPYKPNTAIGTLDTQHIRVVPKDRNFGSATQRTTSPGHKPFESTFRLKVHLPRNQLFVYRVSMKVRLDDVMRKVCDEKNLDATKYEFRHPDNLDKVLDPKRTLSDYNITEIHVVAKGSTRLSSAFSASDIMALRHKDEERKTKTGLFGLFKKTKTTNGSGSLSSENRSISPTQSDDSRSVTPPVQQQIMKTEPEKPKPPQRKRRPAPKPPQQPQPPQQQQQPQNNEQSENLDKLAEKKTDNGLIISHSRNSSDSSGYHEASILSDNANTSLPRPRPQTLIDIGNEKLHGEHSRSTGNLTNMLAQSKSTCSLAVTGRKKKAPPPPPALKSASSATSLQKPSPLVASPVEKPDSPTLQSDGPPTPLPRSRLTASASLFETEMSVRSSSSEAPQLKQRLQPPTSGVSSEIDSVKIAEESTPQPVPPSKERLQSSTPLESEMSVRNSSSEAPPLKQRLYPPTSEVSPDFNSVKITEEPSPEPEPPLKRLQILSTEYDDIEENDMQAEKRSNIFYIENSSSESDDADKNSLCSNDQTNSIEEKVPNDLDMFTKQAVETTDTKVVYVKPKVVKLESELTNEYDSDSGSIKNKQNVDTEEVSPQNDNRDNYAKAIETIHKDLFSSEYKKTTTPLVLQQPQRANAFDTLSRRRGAAAFAHLSTEVETETNSVVDSEDYRSLISSLESEDFDDLDEMVDINDSMFKPKEVTKRDSSNSIDHLMGMHSYRSPILKTDQSTSSLTSMSSFGNFGMQKWSNREDLDGISLASVDGHDTWVIGDSDTDSITPQSIPNQEELLPPTTTDYTTNSPPESLASSVATTLSSTIDTDINPSKENSEIVENEKTLEVVEMTAAKPDLEDLVIETPKETYVNELDCDWQYQLPSPPTAFRDLSPPVESSTIAESATDKFATDSVVTSPELFEKLQVVKDNQSEAPSIASEEEKPFNKLSLENLEKRQSMVYKRELATSLKYKDEEPIVRQESTTESVSSKRSSVISELEEVLTSTKRSGTLSRSTSKVETFVSTPVDNVLPNFKITTYDVPKKNINIYEDESIVSSSKLNDNRKTFANDNITYRRTSSDDVFKKPLEMNKYKARTLARCTTIDATNTISRSESFNNSHAPINPVKRSKSQISLNPHKDNSTEILPESNLYKSSSLFDVSGLQSLEVMRQIQTSLNQPGSTPDETDATPVTIQQSQAAVKPVAKVVNEKFVEPVVQKPSQPEKILTPQPYQNRGPPSIVFETWSDRKRPPTTLKADSDYKFNTVEQSRNSTGRVSIKVNGSESISSQPSGQVLIKIENTNPTEPVTKSYINQGPVAYRRPHSVTTARPHSFAFNQDMDISRVPIVRSVVPKKPFKDMPMSTSITQITQNEEVERNNFINREALNRITKVNSFSQIAPVVKGFQTTETTFNTLPAKVPNTKTNEYTPNSNVPFSQGILRKTDSQNKLISTPITNNVVLRKTSFNSPNNKNRYSTGSFSINNNTILNHNNTKNLMHPPPPAMPKEKVIPRKQDPVQDPRDALLNAIRDFGGKQGLKKV